MEDKPIVLMDEPFSALDAATRLNMQNLALDLLTNKTVLFVTHDPLEALRIADNIYLMVQKPAKLIPIVLPDEPVPRDITKINLLKIQSDILQWLM
jgi:putative hydroxymethylpyrimidine transport system ATP-binding protein